MARNIAIVGMSPSAMDCPKMDSDWEVWCLAWDRTRLEFADMAFEIHKPAMWSRYGGWERGAEYVQHLKDLKIPVVMQKRFEGFPTAVAFPIDEILNNGSVTGDYSRDYFGSSIAYMIALAWHLRVDRLGIWGVELTQADYHHQRPNLEYWIGRCEERGIPVEVHGHRGFLMQLCAHPAQSGQRFLRYGWIEAPQ